MTNREKLIRPSCLAPVLGITRKDICLTSQTLPKENSLFIPTLVLTEHFLPERGGSIHWLVQTYSRYAPGEVVFVVGQYDGNHDVDQNLPFPINRIPMKMSDWDPFYPPSLSRYLYTLWNVRKACFHHRIQQIHCAKVFQEGLVAWWLSRLISVPYLLYAHGEEILIALTSRKLRWLMPKIYQGAGAIIANSQHTKSLLEGVGVSSEKIHVIHPGVDAETFRVSAEAIVAIRERHHLRQSPVLLTVGRLQRRKGQDMVIHALPRIEEKFPDVRYLIVGTGEEESALQELAQRLGVQNRVIFVGQLAEEELAAYFAACDVFIMPNRQIGGDIEGFGIVFLEAGAAGKPVIGGKSGGTGEAIVEGKTGLRVDGENVGEIVDAVVSLLSDPARARAMGEYGRWRAQAEFSWAGIVDRTRAVATALV